MTYEKDYTISEELMEEVCTQELASEQNQRFLLTGWRRFSKI